jgi:CubicO group peptidase (beta-lactamase class C family)
VFSVSKGVSALVISLLLDNGVIDLDRRVAEYWPEFSAEGKAGVLVRELLSHQSGLVGVEDGFAVDELCHSEVAAQRLAALVPWWRPGSAFGYHSITLGVLMEELVRRVTGATLQQLYAERIRDPYAAAFYLGLPESEEHLFTEVLPSADGATGPLAAGSLRCLASAIRDEDGFIASGSPALVNRVDVRRAGLAAVGGVIARGIPVSL